MTELFGPSDQRPIAAHFVVLDGLGVGDDSGIEHRLVFDFARRLIGLLDDAVDRWTLRSARLLAELLEGLLKALDLLVGFLKMGFSPATRSRLVAFSIIFGSDLRICCSA